MAKVLSDDEVKTAATYFSGLTADRWLQQGGRNRDRREELRPAPAACGSSRRMVARKPIGDRIIVLPKNAAEAQLRDPHFGFIDYVPARSIAKGEALAITGGDDKTIRCAICHGQNLTGLGEVPLHRWTHPAHTYLRQLNDMQSGTRKGPVGRPDEGRRRETDAERHDRACGISGIPQSVARRRGRV